MPSDLFARLVIVAGVTGALIAAPRPIHAQKGAAAPAAAPAVPASSPHRVAISKAIYGDAGMIINARNDGFIEIAAAGPKKTVLLQLGTLAARAWVDTTYRMLRARPKRSKTPRTYRSDIEEHGTSGTMALTRKVTGGESEYALFFSDDPLGGFTIPLERSEADVFVATVRRAVATSTKLLEPPDRPAASADSAKPKAASKPAAKRPAKPAAKP